MVCVSFWHKLTSWISSLTRDDNGRVPISILVSPASSSNTPCCRSVKGLKEREKSFSVVEESNQKGIDQFVRQSTMFISYINVCMHRISKDFHHQIDGMTHGVLNIIEITWNCCYMHFQWPYESWFFWTISRISSCFTNIPRGNPSAIFIRNRLDTATIFFLSVSKGCCGFASGLRTCVAEVQFVLVL